MCSVARHRDAATRSPMRHLLIRMVRRSPLLERLAFRLRALYWRHHR